MLSPWRARPRRLPPTASGDVSPPKAHRRPICTALGERPQQKARRRIGWATGRSVGQEVRRSAERGLREVPARATHIVTCAENLSLPSAAPSWGDRALSALNDDIRTRIFPNRTTRACLRLHAPRVLRTLRGSGWAPGASRHARGCYDDRGMRRRLRESRSRGPDAARGEGRSVRASRPRRSRGLRP